MTNILDIFREISSIPRCSGNEKQIGLWLVSWVKDKNLDAKLDDTGNVIINVKASKGYEDADPVVLQGHLDMVCVKSLDSKCDMDKDPIVPVDRDGWLMAENTSLGADNGIGMAISLAIAIDPEVQHPALELLFTTKEETGMDGAIAINGDLLKGKYLINIDSEDDNTFTIGCAGGIRSEVNNEFKTEKITGGVFYELSVSGGTGGHSGVDIHRKRANSNVVLARLIQQIMTEIKCNVVSFEGGTADNVICPNSRCVIQVPQDCQKELSEILKSYKKEIEENYAKTDPKIKVDMTETHINLAPFLCHDDSYWLIEYLCSLPDGVIKMSENIEGLVETSTNLGVVNLSDGKLHMKIFQRSSSSEQLETLNSEIANISKKNDLELQNVSKYPSWYPDLNSSLLKKFKEKYVELFGKEPKVEAVHAGLECSVFREKYKEMDMISIGPTIRGAHTVNEKVKISSVEKVYSLIKTVLAALK